MTLDVIDNIRQMQASLIADENLLPPEHKPEMLLIGCVDARLNITTEIGIPYGKALIYRNVAALIAGIQGHNNIEYVSESEAAVLEFAVNVMRVKTIVVMGHTDCGGIRASLDGATETKDIEHYLTPLNEIRNEILNSGGDEIQQARAMEKAAVQQSLENLMTYNVVKEAVAEGRLQLNGWVINTATKCISEMDLKTGKFKLMAK